MNKVSFQKLLDTDNLLAAANLLIEENPKSKTARSIRGRLIELERQNNQGVIKSTDYTVEKNRIRTSLLEIMDGEPDEEPARTASTEVNSIVDNKQRILVFILGAVLLMVVGLVYFNQSENSENAKTTVSKEVDRPLTEKEKGDMSTEELETFLQTELRKKGLGFDSGIINMAETKTYKQVLATLVRKYTWQVSFPISVKTSDAEVISKEGSNMFLVKISKLKVGTRFSIGGKQSKTISNSLWIEDTSKDGSFWESVNNVTRGKMKREVFDNKKFTNALKSKATTLVSNEINQLLKVSGAGKSEVKVVIGDVGY